MKKKKRKYFDPSAYVSRQIEARTNRALYLRNVQFSKEHARDTKQQLLEYLRRQAQELGKTPNKEEIIGGAYIGYRFDGYIKAVTAAGLPLPGRLPAPSGRKIYRQEQALQVKLYREEKEEAKVRKERDRLWGEEHREDTDEQLIDYVIRCAGELGHTPYAKEVIGGEYIRNRLGGWSVALTLAGIPLAEGMKRPSEDKIKEYLRNRKALM